MPKGIIVDVPAEVYVSYMAERTVENAFHFTLFKEFQSLPLSKKAADRSNILISPTVYIRGFEQFLKIPQSTPEEQRAQITAAAKRFVESLVFGEVVATKVPDWSVSYQYYEEQQSLEIVIMYKEFTLPNNFSLKLSSNNFICNTTDTHNAVILGVHTEGFEGLFGETDNYQDYSISVNVQYAPCITKFLGRCGELESGSSLCINPAYDDKVTFQWEIAGNGKIEHTLQRGDTYLPAASTQTTITDTVKQPAIYTLQANNQKGFSDVAQISVLTTKWHKVGAVSGLFTETATFETSTNNPRIFYQNGGYYCYQNAALYRSTDGCLWTEFSKNTSLPAGTNLSCLSCGLWKNFFYVMFEAPGKRLSISMYDFTAEKWQYSGAYQNCISPEGSLAFSEKKHYYCQTAAYGLRICGHEPENWNHWNLENLAVETGIETLSSGLCFWKHTFYAAAVCKNGRLYYYKCDTEYEDALFSIETGKISKIALLPTTNTVYIAREGGLIDTATHKDADSFFPSKTGNPWLGSSSDSVFGIFPDKTFWIYKD